MPTRAICAVTRQMRVSCFLIPHSLRLALCLVPFCLSSGCRRLAVAPATPRSARIEALLPLHPAWEQTQALNRVVAGLAPFNRVLSGAVPPLPPPFAFTQTAPKNMADERKKRIQDDAEQYLIQLTSFLIADNAQRLAREVRARQRQADAQYRRELETKIAELTAAAAKQRNALNAQINRLGYKLVAYDSQGRIFIGQSQRDAKEAAKQVTRQIDDLTAQRDAISSDFRSAAVAQMRTRRAELNQSVSDFRKRRAEQLAAELRDQIDNRSRQLDAAASAITTFGANLPATPKPAAVPTPPPPDFSAANRAAQAQIASALQRQNIAANAQRDRLLAVIRADTEQAVAQIAARENWKLVPVGTQGATDATDAVAKALREQWKPAPAQ